MASLNTKTAQVIATYELADRSVRFSVRSDRYLLLQYRNADGTLRPPVRSRRFVASAPVDQRAALLRYAEAYALRQAAARTEDTDTTIRKIR